jgi:hypothetical protein
MSIPKIFLALFLFISVTQISCKKDSDASIVGKWTLESRREKVTAPTGSDTPSSDDTYPGDGETAEFRSNGTASNCFDGSCTNGYYKVSGKTLTTSSTSDFSEPYELTILTLTSKKLVLYEKYTYNDGGDLITEEYWDTFTR